MAPKCTGTSERHEQQLRIRYHSIRANTQRRREMWQLLYVKQATRLRTRTRLAVCSLVDSHPASSHGALVSRLRPACLMKWRKYNCKRVHTVSQLRRLPAKLWLYEPNPDVHEDLYADLHEDLLHEQTDEISIE